MVLLRFSLILFIFSPSVVLHGQVQEVTRSLLGQPLYPIRETPRNQKMKDSLLQIALDHFEDDSIDLSNIIWLGRRLAYLTRYPEAIEVYSRGMEIHPEAPELYRHRGHRYLSMRNIDAAITDFNRAVELAAGRSLQIEPDGIPNRLNKPLSSLQFNIFYHLGLAHYLTKNWEKAVAAYLKCMEYSVNDDLLVATTDWLYMTYRRMGEDEKAAELLQSIGEDLEIIENDSYYKRIKFYQGKMTSAELLGEEAIDQSLTFATQGYGLGNYWPAFGYLAAEADLASMD